MKKRSVLFVVMGILLAGMLVFTACGSSSPAKMVDNLEDLIKSNVPGGDSTVLATVEGEKIYKKVFDLQLDMFLKHSSRLSQAQQLKMKGNPRFLTKLLYNMIDTKVILKEVKANKKMLQDTEFLVFLNMQLAEGIKQYYMYKKMQGNISTEVTDQEIAKVYNQYKKDPRMRARLARIPFAKLKEVLRSRILQRRQQLALRAAMDKLKAKYRIVVKDDVFGAPTKGSDLKGITIPKGKKSK